MTALLPLHNESDHRPGSPALVLVAHGSRDPRTLATVHTLLDRIRELRPGLRVHLGHIELNEPLLPATLAALGDEEAILVPLLLSRGYHIKQDIPEMAAAARAHTRVAAPLGPHPLLVETLYTRLVESGWRRPTTESERRSTAVILAAAGSRDPDASIDTGHTATLLSTRLGVPVLPAYASAATPTVPEAVRILRSDGRHNISLASYFTAPGRFATESAEAAPGTAAAPLGAHPLMARLVLTRYEEARSTSPTGRLELASA
ncbi:sirohydrochlorin chelatase [Streptomyces sp. TRM70350]|uniref:sirohydrochlorin chelatase n=1 Tax=Streptomyces sp. TRM70350 TaxID=2856165 RepID=UPI001C465072|nr:sirohydrochlorin chelatase [Streptomyces sp. TRM70350]MBV7697746.1 sirohydrochlorin chelatase [Streptomyces sp. TRM70350]